MVHIIYQNSLYSNVLKTKGVEHDIIMSISSGFTIQVKDSLYQAIAALIVLPRAWRKVFAVSTYEKTGKWRYRSHYWHSFALSRIALITIINVSTVLSS